MTINSNENKLNAIKYKFDKGLIPRGSDLYLLASKIWSNDGEEVRQQGADGGTEQSVSPASKRGSKKTRVRQRRSVRTTTSNSKDKTVEGDSRWEVKTQDRPQQK